MSILQNVHLTCQIYSIKGGRFFLGGGHMVVVMLMRVTNESVV